MRLMALTALLFAGTASAQTLFVDGALGSDANACVAAGASACQTIQGAINKLPKRLTYGAKVSIAPGSYAGFIVSGFDFDYGVQQASAGLLFDGALANSTLATGPVAGTATSGSVGTNETFGTLTDTSATWTTNDLVGRFVTTSNTTAAFVIESNTVDTITIVGTSAIAWAAPVSGVTTYAIQEPSVIINTAANQPAVPLLNQVSSRAAIVALDNGTNMRNGAITFRNMRLAPTTGDGVAIGNGSYQLVAMQVRPTSTVAKGVRGAQGFAVLTPMFVVSNSDVFLSASSGEAINWGSPIPFTVNGSSFRGTSQGQYAISTTSVYLQYSKISGFTNGVLQQGVVGSIIASNRIVCGSTTASTAISGGWARTGLPDPTSVGAHADLGHIDHVDVSQCETAIYLTGMSTMTLHGLRGDAGTVGVLATNGAFVSLNTANLLSGFTAPAQLSLDGLTADFADVTSGLCLSPAGTASRVCGM